MRRQALPGVIAVITLLAFALGATAFDGVVIDNTGENDGEDTERPITQSETRGGDQVQSSPPDGAASSCGLCDIRARALLEDLVPASGPSAVVGLTVVSAIVAAFIGVRSTRGTRVSNETAEQARDGSPSDTRSSEPARSTYDADLTNEIYRAWASMTRQVAVKSPAQTTPGEYATAAVDAGFNETAVKKLTRLFQAVRYGGSTPTADKERAAKNALAALEADNPEET